MLVGNKGDMPELKEVPAAVAARAAEVVKHTTYFFFLLDKIQVLKVVSTAIHPWYI